MTRDCYTCSRTRTWLGPGTPADCYALTGDEKKDALIIEFCEASGVNDEPTDRPGWPREGNTIPCPKWGPR